MNRIAASVLLLIASAGLAAAQSAPPPAGYAVAAGPPGHHTHDGFYFRGILGLNGTVMSTTNPDVDVSGAGGTFGLAVGWALAKNFILYGEIFDDIAVNPTITIGSLSVDTDDTAAGVIGFGIGAAYYFMPINIYVSATLAASQLTVSQGGQEVGESDIGFGVSLMVGKEWWVSSNWGIGAALQVYGGTMKDSRNENAATWTTAAIALVFSATYN
jgi:hypothetical protein